jgi:hypothetical protein
MIEMQQQDGRPGTMQATGIIRKMQADVENVPTAGGLLNKKRVHYEGDNKQAPLK